MASARIGQIKAGKKVTRVSSKDLEAMVANPNTRGRDLQKVKRELAKREATKTV